MATDVIQRVRRAYPTMSNGQKRLASAVIHSYERITHMSLPRFAELGSVSKSTALRFVKALEYQTYTEFQKEIQKYVRTKIPPAKRMEALKRRFGKSDILNAVVNNSIKRIRNVADTVDRDAFNKSVDALIEARYIYIIATRNEKYLAKILAHNLSLAFDNIRFIDPSSTEDILEQMFCIDFRDALMVLSFSKPTLATSTAARFAKQRKATVISIADTEFAPVNEFCTHLLLAPPDLVGYTDSLLTPHCIINAIVLAITYRRELDVMKRLDKLEKVWNEHNAYNER